jgi:4-hydroxy-tetrahydrodipicolinate synthase
MTASDEPGEPFVRGVCPVLEVPFHADGAVDHGGFDRVVAQVLGSGVRSVMFPGFASEFHKLSSAERTALRDRLLAVTATREDVTAIVSVPDHATRIAVAEARGAVEAGADAINVLPPHFLGPSPAAVGEHLAAVLDAVAPVPVVLQYAPAQVGVTIDVQAIKRLAVEHPNLALVKVESVPPGRLVAALLEPPRPVYGMVGYAGIQMIDALERGAVGVQPGCSFPELYQAIWRSWEAGERDEAAALHRRLLPYLTYFMSGTELMVAMEKHVSMRRGWFASDHCRAPGHVLDGHERRLVAAFLDEFADRLA